MHVGNHSGCVQRERDVPATDEPCAGTFMPERYIYSLAERVAIASVHVGQTRPSNVAYIVKSKDAAYTTWSTES